MTMEAELKKIVGQQLQQLRIKKNFTQEAMAEKLSLSTSAYCKIEYGETDLTLTRLNKIAEILNISMFELLSKIDENKHFYRPEISDPNNTNQIKNNTHFNQEETGYLRELIRANSKLIEMLNKRVETLENRK